MLLLGRLVAVRDAVQVVPVVEVHVSHGVRVDDQR